jgi:hypothetical protein
VPRERLGVASGMQATMRNLGFALGVALAGAVVAAWGGALADPTLLLGFGPALRVSAGLALAALVISAMRPGDACRDGAAEGGGTIRGPLGAGGGTEAR